MSHRIRRIEERGKITMWEEEEKVILERRLIGRCYRLVLDRSECSGCGICADMCPKEAIEYFPERSKRERRTNFIPDNCVLCGVCVVVCPMDKALRITVEGEEKIPVVG